MSLDTINNIDKTPLYNQQEDGAGQKPQHIVLPPVDLPLPDSMTQITEDLTYLKGHVKEIKFDNLLKECRKSLKEDIKKAKSEVVKRGVEAFAPIVAVIALGILTIVGIGVAFAFCPIAAIPLIVFGPLVPFIPMISYLFFKEDCLGTYQKATQKLSEKKIKLANLDDESFISFVKKLENIPLTKDNLTSDAMHNLYKAERQIEDLSQRIDIIEKYIDASTAHLEWTKDTYTMDLLKEKLTVYQSRLRERNSKQTEWRWEATRCRKALASPSKG